MSHTKPGFSKANKSLSLSDYKNLLELAAQARKLINANHKLNYIRVFTEPRKGGLRTKFWGIQGIVSDAQVKAIQHMLTKHFPQLAIDVKIDASAWAWGFNSLSISLRVKPDTFTSKPAPVAQKPKARLSGAPLIMQSAVVDVATIPAGTLSIETQMHIGVGSKTNNLEFELVDSWLLLNGEFVHFSDSDPYHNYLILHLGRSKDQIYKDAVSAAEEVMRKSIVLHGKRMFIG